jgi:hypothetical protein
MLERWKMRKNIGWKALKRREIFSDIGLGLRGI